MVPELEFEGRSLRRCPSTLITAGTVEYIRAHLFMEKGFLPNPGTYMDQPDKLIDAMEYFGYLLAEQERKQAEDARTGPGRAGLPRATADYTAAYGRKA